MSKRTVLTNKNLREDIDYALCGFGITEFRLPALGDLRTTNERVIDVLMPVIKARVLELIGDDVLAEQYSNANPKNKYLVAENRLRAELRRKVEEL